MPKLPDEAFLDLAPDWACEILSASTERIDRVEKRAIHAREGVTHLWFVAPEAKVLEVFALDAGSYRLLGSWAADALVHAPPFDALARALTELWLD